MHRHTYYLNQFTIHKYTIYILVVSEDETGTKPKRYILLFDDSTSSDCDTPLQSSIGKVDGEKKTVQNLLLLLLSLHVLVVLWYVHFTFVSQSDSVSLHWMRCTQFSKVFFHFFLFCENGKKKNKKSNARMNERTNRSLIHYYLF